MKLQTGFSLIELLVSLFLGSLLMIMLVKLYFSFRETAQWQDTLAAIQERERFGAYFLAQRIRQAGDSTCEPGETVDQSNAVIGYDSDHLPPDLRKESIPNSDVIVIGECLRYHNKLQFIKTAYFISDMHRKEKGKPVFSLYEKPMDGARQELIADVNKLTIHYGVSSSDRQSIRYYHTAAAIKNWEAIKSVNLTLFFHSNLMLLKKWHLYVTLRERF
ncbi:PilW family protein [Coxiella burnetii]|uniref:PilW family protein n=1 Tax=Coxiella burnetii TaxID=777 RepID=UPI000183CF81|nr:PilW family protein [Coxiella burnetii]ACJ17945.1 hypothetical protein CbuG_0526 [Coxiella burnetii CbuG_Q212]OYK86689.1 pilus assembly protein PilW [Coxiella burnetii]